jgi:predicted secreted hydrolase
MRRISWLLRRTSWLWATLLIVGVGCARPVAPLPEVPAASPTMPLPVTFPRDAAPHDALIEWWYYTGHLSDADKHSFGFEYTVFQVRRQSAPTGYLAHFAVTDIDAQRFSHQSRATQGEAVLAFPIDVNGWRLGTDGRADTIDASMVFSAGADPPFAAQLRLTDDKPPALHHGGFIDEGPAGGSYYYSRTRLTVSGTLQQADAAPLAVSGLAWMDHQWGDFVVTRAGGWDWYSLQLDDRTDLMLYVLRDAHGRTTGVYGTQVLADGTTQDVAADTVQAAATGTWTSPHTGAVYPSGWRLTLPAGDVLEVQPVLQDQELYFPGVGGTTYWEGAVTVTGTRTGVGYVELTGYADR